MESTNRKLSELGAALGTPPVDVFICSASFESRCRSIVDSLGTVKVTRSIVAYNLDFLPVVSGNLAYLSEKLSERTGKNQHFELGMDTSHPIRTADHIAHEVDAAIEGGGHRFVIDVTTFTRESLLILVRYLKGSLKTSDSVLFLYAHAKEYSTGDEDREKWLTKGIREVRSVLGYPGDLLPSRLNHLIILVGFEDERALSLIRECEPARISLGLGDPVEPGTRPHQDVNEHRFAKLKHFLQSVSEFAFKGYDAEATYRTLKEQVRATPGLNTIVAPMNTKVSTLGAAALALEDRSIQLCYAQANVYNHSRYSLPDDNFYAFTVPGLP